jgi:hypothetical protein
VLVRTHRVPGDRARGAALRRRLADAGEAERDAGLADAGRLLGAALAPVVATLDSARWCSAARTDLLDGALRARARHGHPAAHLRRPTPATSCAPVPLGDDVGLVGAAATVLAAELGVA